MLALLGFIFALTLLVFIHEFGHYYAAKTFGVKVEEFSIGFGKELFSKIDRAGVKWKICALPLGGFVKMYGDANPASLTHVEVQDKHRAFYAKPLYARFLIVAAGPIANYLLAIVILTGFYFSYGKLEMPAVIGEVLQNSPAQAAGIIERDEILEVDGGKITNFNDLQRRIMINPGRPMDLLVLRGDELKKIVITPLEKVITGERARSKIGYIGVKAKDNPIFINIGLFESISISVTEVIDISNLTLKALGQMLTGHRSTSEIYGPLTIAKESGKSLSHSPLEFILFIAMLSINLGLINLLPVPILDGGHLIFMVYEAIAQKPLSGYMQNVLLKIGMVIIIFLVVISISNDIRSLIL